MTELQQFLTISDIERELAIAANNPALGRPAGIGIIVRHRMPYSTRGRSQVALGAALLLGYSGKSV